MEEAPDTPVETPVEVAGRGKKQCKQCQKFVGVRTRTCECGYEFSTVAATSEKMTVDTDTVVKGSVSSVKSILDRVTEKNPPKYGGYSGGYDYYDSYDYPSPQKPLVDTTIPARTDADTSKPSWYSKPAGEVIDYSQPNDTRYFPKVSGRNIVVPSGDCPVKPKGFKAGWPDGKASPEVVKEWALAVYHSGDGYAPDAVLYWARYFWDINDRPEYGRVRNLIIEAIFPQEA